MKDEKLSIHFLLNKQMHRSNCSQLEMPPNIQDWQEFLLRVSRAYFDMEQERYLLDRAMEISSYEMNELNKKLEDAQSLAHMGYWAVDLKTNKTMWTTETFKIMGINPNVESPNVQEYFSFVYEEDRNILKEIFRESVANNEKFELEYRVMLPDGSIRWCFARGQPERAVSIGDDTIPQPTQRMAGILMDITERKNSEAQIHAMHQKLLDTARLAGMSEVATSVLHNIGNVLNSANVSVTMLKDKQKNDYLEKLNLLVENLVQKFEGNDFANDIKDKKVFEYMKEVVKILLSNSQDIVKEIESLTEHLDHIKSIVQMQNSISGLSGIREKLNLAEIVDLAIQLSINSKKAEKIQIIKDCEKSCYITTDKVKLLQVLVNMIRNAQDALMLAENIREKTLKISLLKEQNNYLIKVEDNGIGISEATMAKIFNLGFTTKESGHGFGLHSSSISAKELGGRILVKSDGEYKGATFTLELPVPANSNSKFEVSHEKGASRYESI